MNKTFVILKHEFLQTIKRKTFIIMSLAFPLLALLGIGGYQVFQGVEAPPADTISFGYVDEVGIFDGFTEPPGEPPVSLTPFATPEEAVDALLDEQVSEFFIIPEDYLTTGLINRFTLERELETPGQSASIVRSFLLSNLLEGQASDAVIERVQALAFFFSITLDETGQVAEDQGSVGALLVPLLFGILLLLSIFTSSGFLLQGLSEEKENRIMEILLSSVSTRQLITGKVLGLGAAGLAQMFFWLLSARLIIEVMPAGISDALGGIEVSAGLLALSLLYFILGYLLFAILMAGIGAIGATARESQQLSTVFILPTVLSLEAAIFLIEDPGNIIAQVLTYIPLTSPIMVIMRLGQGEIALWEILISLVLLVAAIAGSLWLVTKVFRSFLLMYGKTPRFREIVRRLREA
ncbi:MAG: ABC transporter permease [Dehalococcoidales bacterium]|jgi:ABC-2 type transport system permease protein